MFDHCVDHLFTLYHEGKYAQAIDTTFVTQHTMSWAMLAIFGAVVLVITISMLLVCQDSKEYVEQKRQKRNALKRARTSDSRSSSPSRRIKKPFI